MKFLHQNVCLHPVSLPSRHLVSSDIGAVELSQPVLRLAPGARIPWSKTRRLARGENGLFEQNAPNQTAHGVEESPVLVLMHFLGGSTREWDEVVPLLGSDLRTMRLDLPGFGDSAAIDGYSVEAMADFVEANLRTANLDRFLLVGHSMSGKVAMVLARRLEDAQDPRLLGMVLVAPSPPSPEPISADKRTGMIEALGTAHEGDLDRARSYITKNEERDIPVPVVERAAGEVLRMNRDAWLAWLTDGSKEDWSERVGTLQAPVLVVAGELDRSLGPDQQKAMTMPHLRHAHLAIVAGCSHLIPMERPEQMAALLRKFTLQLMSTSEQPAVPTEYLNLIASDRLSTKTREVLKTRMRGPVLAAGFLTPEQESTLRAAAARIVPQTAAIPIDLAGFVIATLASGKGNGWRYAVLPEDLTAYRNGLDQLAAHGFAGLDAEKQDACLRELSHVPGSPEARWFEELRGDLTDAYMAHPATLARIGYSGIGVGGARTPHQGFVLLGPNQREAWEPEVQPEVQSSR